MYQDLSCPSVQVVHSPIYIHQCHNIYAAPTSCIFDQLLRVYGGADASMNDTYDGPSTNERVSVLLSLRSTCSLELKRLPTESHHVYALRILAPSVIYSHCHAVFLYQTFRCENSQVSYLSYHAFKCPINGHQIPQRSLSGVRIR